MDGSNDGTKPRWRVAKAREAKRVAVAEFQLADLIGALRDELDKAAIKAKSNKSRAGVWREATLEVSLTMDHTKSGKIGLRALTIGGERSHGDTARLTVTLVPPTKEESTAVPVDERPACAVGVPRSVEGDVERV